jgi:hypothetical protein
MPDNDATIRKIPRVKSPDSFIQETAEQSTRNNLLTVHFPGVGKILVSVAVGEELVLGRFEANDTGPLCLNLIPFKAGDAGVSRRHAKIKHAESGWWIEDIGSSNGTWVDGERLLSLKPCRLQLNSHVLLANLECYVILPVSITRTEHKHP